MLVCAAYHACIGVGHDGASSRDCAMPGKTTHTIRWVFPPPPTPPPPPPPRVGVAQPSLQVAGCPRHPAAGAFQVCGDPGGGAAPTGLAYRRAQAYHQLVARMYGVPEVPHGVVLRTYGGRLRAASGAKHRVVFDDNVPICVYRVLPGSLGCPEGMLMFPPQPLGCLPRHHCRGRGDGCGASGSLRGPFD